jgi:NDP-sugar pyrophosphorylase family protein
VLTAGLGTRLRPFSLVRAKAALPVAGTPIVERIITWLAAAGVWDIVLNLHHLPDSITAITGDGAHLGVRVRYSWEVPLLGSAGGPRRALPLLDSSTFLIANGDTLTNVDVEALAAAHTASGALVTLALTPNRQPDKYGGILLDEHGAMIGHRRSGEPGEGFHFVGVQAAERDAFAGLADGVPAETVTEWYRDVIRARPGSIRGFVTDAEFFDIGTPHDYFTTSLALAERETHGNDIVWNDLKTLMSEAVVGRG